MPLTYEIFPSRGVVLITYSGRADIDETARVFADFAQHPEAKPGQKHLLDLSRVTDVERDFPRLMALQARKAGELGLPIMPSMLVYYCPTRISRHMADMVYKSWDGLNGPALAIIEEEAEALALVGCPEASIADLKRRVSED
ncbi:hypothetical protein KUL25_02925 [Rhodobacteraceae bacterium N5(2021)]|uniref:Uncharacterized protein n=1 Tax=Gymnodinialimonas phycosphaerae TaxID=2841589 RepID=A0A975TWJ5_9RHOB|nr:hypothetical protein [Gymnodinialimonas phycosphaerae]MBY4891715.1 hypothetical protein [Gymnodinialimonas phycosphaerae]